MPQTPIAQPAEAAATRINQLTERMLTAARNAGGGERLHPFQGLLQIGRVVQRDDHPVEQAG